MAATRIEIFIITKNGMMLYKYNLLDSEETAQDQLIGGFLSAINNFAKDIGFPDGVSLIRSGSLEARFSSGQYIFSVLMIDYSVPLGLATEGILSGLSSEISQNFEERYHDRLIAGEENSQIYRMHEFSEFRSFINDLIDRYGKETLELYQKLVLIESLYAKVPQKWILPLLERVSAGEHIYELVNEIPENYHKQLRQAIDKVNFSSGPLWTLFAIPSIRLKEESEEGSFL